MHIPENDFILCKSVIYTTDLQNIQVGTNCLKGPYLAGEVTSTQIVRIGATFLYSEVI